jgi:hypothetical protein
MSIIYTVDPDLVTRLWEEWLWLPQKLHFDNWMREVRVPYADDVNIHISSLIDSQIIFKEEKDLTYFLLTL